MKPSRGSNRIPPGRGGGDSEIVEVAGGPVYHMPVPPAKYRGPLIPMGTEEDVPEGVPPRPGPGAFLRKRTPLVPTYKEIESLPRLAQTAFAERCALRVKPVRAEGVATATDAARVIFETATIDTPLTAQLRCIRRDFVRLEKRALKEKWTDDTPVPPEAFGPMWPEGVAPYWAVEPPPATPQAAGG